MDEMCSSAQLPLFFLSFLFAAANVVVAAEKNIFNNSERQEKKRKRAKQSRGKIKR